MRDVLLSVTALIVSLTLLLTGNSLQFVILGLRSEAEGFSVTIVGAMTAAYYIGYGLGSLQAANVVERVGHIRTFAAMSSIVSVTVLAHGLWADPVAWIALRFLTGLAFAGLATCAESWLNARASRAVRGRVLSIASICAISGYAVGPLFGAIGAVDGLFLFVVASILMSVALVPVTLTRFSAPMVSGDGAGFERYSVIRLFQETPLGFVGCLGTGVVQGAFLGLGAVFAGRAGLSDAGASIFVTAALAAGALAQYPLGWLSDRLDRRRVLALSATVLGLGGLLVAGLLQASAGLPVLALAAAVAGIGAMPLYPIVIAYVNDRLPESSIVPAAATLILTFSVGSAVAAPAASLAMEAFGPGGLYGFLGLALLGLGLFAVVRMFAREAPEPSAEGVLAVSGPFVPVDETIEETQLSLDLEPPDEAAA
jgi:MFS family permease